MRFEFEGSKEELVSLLKTLIKEESTKPTPPKFNSTLNDVTRALQAVPSVPKKEVEKGYTVEPIERKPRRKGYKRKTRGKVVTTQDKAKLIERFRKRFNSRQDIIIKDLVDVVAPHVPVSTADKYFQEWIGSTSFAKYYERGYYKFPESRGYGRICYKFVGPAGLKAQAK